MILKEDFGNAIPVTTKIVIPMREDLLTKYSEIFTDANQAIAREKQIKGWSGKNKQALIARNFDKLKELAKSKPKSQ